jgi:hypothetical protein
LNKRTFYLLIVSTGLLGLISFQLTLYQAGAQTTILPGTEDIPESSFQNTPPPPNVRPNFTASSIVQNLSYAHFLPLTNNPGNQIKLVVNYTTPDISVVKQEVNAVMDILSANNSFIKKSSFDSPFIVNQSGSIQLATTLTDEDITNVTAVAEFTDPQKVIPISNPIEINLKLNQIIQN